MTTATFNYVASLYESAVDSGLDVQAIRLFLAEHGIRRTPAQVVHDLDYMYAFTGYADSHPAPAMKTAAELDKELEAMTQKEVGDFNRAWDAAALSNKVYIPYTSA